MEWIKKKDKSRWECETDDRTYFVERTSRKGKAVFAGWTTNKGDEVYSSWMRTVKDGKIWCQIEYASLTVNDFSLPS